MWETNLIFVVFTIFLGAALLSTVALLTRQSMLLAYIALGILLGPWGFGFVSDTVVVSKVGEVGIIFLLFLLGLNLHPQKLYHLLKKVSIVGVVSSLLFACVGYGVAWLFGFTSVERLIIGAAMMFSSTIIGIKLLPTTVLHHQHTGELMISVLLLQDLLAILCLLILHTISIYSGVVNDIVMIGLGFPSILIFAIVFERFVLQWFLGRFNRIKEYLFLVAIAWCLGMAQLATYLGLSHEVGAFIAGVSLAASPISLYIAESLKPVRDFFLVMFFFSIGATFNWHYFNTIAIPAGILVVVLSVLKPVTFSKLLQSVDENKATAWEVGVRLAQISEFSLILAFAGLQTKLIGPTAANLIQLTAILSFVVSSYWVVMRFPTPIALSDRLRRD